MTVILMIIAAVVAALIALFQYGYISNTKNTKKKPWFALLRFLTVFCILLLFIAPRFDSKTYESLLPQLIVMVDDSKSVEYLGAKNAIKNDLDLLLENKDVKSKFDIQVFQFSENIKPLDSLGFNKGDSDLGKAITQPQELFKNRNKAIVVLTDGNQTTGNSYGYSKIDNKTSLYPIIYGDTTQYADLQITNINVNRYSYLDNEFPVEVFISYQGTENATRNFTINQGNKTLYKESFTFDALRRSAIASFNLTSTSVGTQSMVATIAPLSREKNTKNNYRSFAVEVIDQQTNVLILSDVMHPDIGDLKKAIESNQQRKVTIKNTSQPYDLNEYNLVVMYGVGSAFAK
ncbi:MAG: vWA domain-containing protein, partial [Nonlabens sp.]